MHNPHYLTISRHHVFYFRFPIPEHLHPQRKRTDIKLSLKTRNPRKALQIARILGYIGHHYLQQPEVTRMEFQQILGGVTFVSGSR